MRGRAERDFLHHSHVEFRSIGVRAVAQCDRRGCDSKVGQACGRLKEGIVGRRAEEMIRTSQVAGGLQFTVKEGV
jgi:hypothetical protein